MNAYLALSAIRAHYRLFLLILFSTVAVTAAVSLLMPKTYIGTVSVMLDERDEQTVRPGANNNSNNNRLLDRERASYLQTQVEIITSPRVARRVVSDLKLADNAELQEKFRDKKINGRIEDWIGEILLKQLKVSPSSTVLELSYAADDANKAAKVANAFAKAYLDTVLELRVEPAKENSAWFNEQVAGLRANMEDAQSRLARFQYDNRIVSTEERMDVDNIQLSELAQQVARLHDPERGNRMHDGDSLPAADVRALADIQILRTDLTRAENKLHELSVDYGPKHPSYVRQSAEVDSLRMRLMSAAKQTAANSAERARRYRERLVGELDSQRERVLKQREARTQMAVLSNNATVAQRVYEAAMQSFITSSIDSHARQTNVRVLDPATPPVRPKSPKIRVNVAIAFVVGIMLGLASIYLREMLDQRVRNYTDLAWDPNVPTLAVLNPWNPATARLPVYLGTSYALPAPRTGHSS
jgi:polysaccharide biosynthesis transport protein